VKFSEIVKQAAALLEESHRITYRALKLEFGLTDEQLDVLKDELIAAKRLAVDEDDKVLVWTGGAGTGEPENRRIGVSESSPQPPSSYTPPHLAERIRAEQATLEARGNVDGERKTITALFADLKGSTALIEGLDPEEARAIIDPALQLMMAAVHRYEGYVAQALGDGILALFGAPLAHEDHPQRALYAALRMQGEMRRYSDQLRLKGGVPLYLRVGVNTGEVVVRSIRKEDLHTDYVPVGHSTNLAARMEQMATPGSILITEHTRKLTEGYFELKALGAAEIKGMEEPLSVFEVLGAGPLRTRLQVAVRRGLTRFVGRHTELEQIKRAFEQAITGHGQVVGVMGEPGLGKSRLFYEFKLTSQSGCLILEAYSVSHGKASPYLPVIELLKDYFDITGEDDERKRREKIIGKVLGLDRSLEDSLPYLFALLGIDERQANLQQMDAQIRRRRTFEALKKLLLRESLNQPLILIFEDLHWIDSETQGFLEMLAESVASTRILLLVNYRPEYRHEWGSKTYYTQLRLAPLSRAEAEEFLDALLGIAIGANLRVGPQGQGAPPSPEFVLSEVEGLKTGSGAPLQDLKRLVLEKTEGTPFFMEEVVQELFEQGVLVRDGVGAGLVPAQIEGAHKGTPLQIPATVQGILAARIDRLTLDEKALLQQLAVVGREFPLSLVKQVIAQPEDELYRLLASLQHKEFLYEQPAFPEVEYIFKHALTQEVAYGTVLYEQRKVLHERTAQAMETLYRATLDEHYSDLAHHYSRSGNIQKAVEYLGLAGQQAVQRSAYTEAVSHLTTALELLQTLPETPVRVQQELALHLALGVPFQTLKGEAAPEVGQTYNRILALCGQVGDTAQFFPALFGLWRFNLIRPDTHKARDLADQMMRLAQNSHDSSLLLEAHRALGTSLFFLGDLRQGRSHLEQGIALYDVHQHRSHAFRYGSDPRVYCLCFAAWNLWCLGYPDQALRNTQEALHLAHEGAHPFTLAFALGITAMFHQFRQEEATVQERAEATLTLSTEHGFAYRAAWATLLQGWALAARGHREEGLVRMQEGLTAQRDTGSEANHPYFLALLAEVYGKMGRPEEGLTALAEASVMRQRTGEQWYEAELYRLKGELTLQKPSGVRGPESEVPNPHAEAEAEECFLMAIEIARRQQAKSWELRAATSLARLWQQQGKEEAARQLLAEIYHWFTEGFDTKDLREAKKLLESLESRA